MLIIVLFIQQRCGCYIAACLTTTVCTPVFIQPHEIPQTSDLHPQDIMLSKVSGAMGRLESIGESMSSSFDPQSVGCKDLPIHSCTVRYVRNECCLAAVLVGGNGPNWKDEERDVFVTAFL